jgi:hypothetical protein
MGLLDHLRESMAQSNVEEEFRGGPSKRVLERTCLRQTNWHRRAAIDLEAP